MFYYLGCGTLAVRTVAGNTSTFLICGPLCIPVGTGTSTVRSGSLIGARLVVDVAEFTLVGHRLLFAATLEEVKAVSLDGLANRGSLEP